MLKKQIKIKRNSIFFLLAMVVVAAGTYYMKLATACFCVAMFQLLTILCIAKLSIFSIFTTLINFCLIQEYVSYVGTEVYGLLEMMNVPRYFFELFVCVYVFNIFMYIVITNTNCLKCESELFKEKMDVGYGMSIALAMLAVIITLLIFPSMPSISSFSSEGRFNNGIISFAGWSCLPFFFLAIALMNKKSTKFVLPMTLFVVCWFIFHGERVDSIGFMTLFAIKYYNEHSGKGALIKEIICAFMVLVLLVAVGMLRSGVNNISFGDLVHSLFIQPTACDVTYVFNCAVDMTKKGLSFHGITYLSYIINCVPLLPDSYSFQSNIHEYYYTAGGGLFFAEPVANFGIGFACVFSCIYIVFLALVVKKQSRYHYMVYAALCITIFRSAWYGLNYPIITILYFAPAILIAYNFLSKRRRT